MTKTWDCEMEDPFNQCDSFLTHTHEFEGSTQITSPPDREDLLHNHRFAGVTGPVIPRKGGHVHMACVNTDFFKNHFHTIEVKTGPPIIIYDKKKNIIGHTHAIVGKTSCVFFHDHLFKTNTLIQNPIDFDC